MTTEGNTRTVFRLALTIDRGGVDIVQAMLQSIVNLFVDHFLIELVRIIHLCRQAHHAITQDRHFFLGLGVLAVGHLTYGRFHLILIFLCGLFSGLVGILTTSHHSSRTHSPCSKHLQKRTARYIFLFHNAYIFLCTS